MKKLAPFLAPYKKESVLGPLFKLLEASFELLVPLVMASIIDRGIGSGDRGHIARMCVLLVALGAVGLVCSLTAQYFAAKAAVGFPPGCATPSLQRFSPSPSGRSTGSAPPPSSPGLQAT